MKSLYPEELFDKLFQAAGQQPKDSIQRVACESTAAMLLVLIYRADSLRKLMRVALALLGVNLVLAAALAILLCFQ